MFSAPPAPPGARRLATTILLLCLAALAIAIGATSCGTAGVDREAALADLSPSAGVPSASARNSSAPAGDQVAVHVVGQVKDPGLYRLPSGSRVADAIDLAGGFAKRADEASVNLARILADGEQVVVAKQGEASSAGAAGSSGVGASAAAGTSPSGAVVNLNTASLDELTTLPRIGPAIGQRIIEYREQAGGFRSIEELKNVSGIGEKTFENLRGLVTVG